MRLGGELLTEAVVGTVEHLQTGGRTSGFAPRLRDEAQKILTQLEEQARTKFVTGYSIAVIRLALGDKAGAMAGLETAAEQHASEFLIIQSDPLLDDLRGDPRFEAFIRKIFGPKPVAP